MAKERARESAVMAIIATTATTTDFATTAIIAVTAGSTATTDTLGRVGSAGRLLFLLPCTDQTLGSDQTCGTGCLAAAFGPLCRHASHGSMLGGRCVQAKPVIFAFTKA